MTLSTTLFFTNFRAKRENTFLTQFKNHVFKLNFTFNKIDISSGLVGLKLLSILNFWDFWIIFSHISNSNKPLWTPNLMSNTPRHFLSTCQLMWFTPPTYKESSYLQRTAMSTKIQMRSKKMSHDSIQRIFKVRFVSSNPWERNNSCWWWLFAVYCISSVWHPLFTTPSSQYISNVTSRISFPDHTWYVRTTNILRTIRKNFFYAIKKSS